MKLFNILVFTSVVTMSSGTAYSEGHEAHSHRSHIKCQTPLQAENTGYFAAKTATRSEREKSAVSADGHFRVHYDTSGWFAPDQTDNDKNGIPDYVDSTLEHFEYAWDLQINVLGYNEPPSDHGLGGGDEVDCYITNYGSTPYYGGTFYDTFILKGSTSSHIVIDNGYTEAQYSTSGDDALKVTTAHEFFHVVQFGYMYSTGLSWWTEQSAVWMEEYAWPEVNDYLQYINDFMLMENTSLSHSNGAFEYGAGIWPMFLAKEFGDDIIKSSWERYAEGDNLSISALDDVIPDGLANAYSEFGIWNYFTKDRANTYDFYSDGDQFPYTVSMDWQAMSKPADGDFSANALTTKYIELLFASNFSSNILDIKVSPSGSAQLKSSLILFDDSESYEIHALESNQGTVSLLQTWEKAVLAVSCTNPYGSGYKFSFDADISSVSVDEDSPLAFAIGSAWPNPFNPATTISFTMQDAGHVSAMVYNVSGQLVETLVNSELDAGEKSIIWKPDNLSGGVYMVRIATAHGTKTVKTLYLK